MDEDRMDYLESDRIDDKVIRNELVFLPFLVLIPLIVGFYLIFDWYNRDFVSGIYNLNGEVVLGLVILLVNLLFDIPFIQSIRKFSKKKN